MSKPNEKKRAIALRRKGHSIKNIAKEVGVSKGSVSVWVRDIRLTQKQKEVLKQNLIKGGHVGRMAGAEWNKEQRRNRLAIYKKDSAEEIK